MNGLSPYHLLIGISTIIILSYSFNQVSKKTSIPSVLLLIILGVILQVANNFFHVLPKNLMPLLEILGIVGLIMIVLEAALDLELKREKWPLLWRSFVVAFFGVLATTFAIMGILLLVLETDFERALLYAIPMAIISSAIVLPSVAGLNEHKKEFLIYESTFSDILGIMFFYTMIKNFESINDTSLLVSATGDVLLTIGVSFVASYAVIMVFQNLKGQVKLFLLIAVLILLYSIGKQLHLSSLLIILVFGLILNNPHVFFIGPIKKFANTQVLKDILEEFKIVTIDSGFVVRTFFFVIFGTTIVLSQLVSLEVFLQSALIIVATFSIRWFFLRVVVGKDIMPQTFIAPRGLITILLFFAIPAQFNIPEFDNGILLYVILATSLLMTWSLIKYKNAEPVTDSDSSLDELNYNSEEEEENTMQNILNKELGISPNDPTE
jgi:Kef-type K+ transport system membrane component KefB